MYDTGIVRSGVGRGTPLAVVARTAGLGLDLERDPVDRDHPHRLAGHHRRGPRWDRDPRPGWVRARQRALATTTTPSGDTSPTAVPNSPIIHSRPIVGVAKRVRVIDGMPTTNVSKVPPMPTSRVIHPIRSDVPGNGS